MEQYMYTFLNQRYGLKSLIFEWINTIINGIKKYMSEDNDVAVFGKILRNESDEEFRFVQSQVKNTITVRVTVEHQMFKEGLRIIAINTFLYSIVIKE